MLIGYTAASPGEVSENLCRHCGEPCADTRISAAAAPTAMFCCDGCEAVFRLLHDNQLDAFYEYDAEAGRSQRYRGALDPARFTALDDPQVAAHVVEFDDGR